MPNIRIQMGERLRKLREKKEWSQEEVASRAGIAARYLSDLELGKKEVCLQNIEKLAKALDVTLAQLMRGL